MFERDCRWDGMRKMARLDTPWQTHHGTLQRITKSEIARLGMKAVRVFAGTAAGDLDS